MENDEDLIVLPVPESVEALYVVPVSDPPPDLAERARDGALRRWDGLLGLMLADLLGQAMPIQVLPTSDVPPLPVELFAAMGATAEQLDRIGAAGHVVIVSVHSPPGWPPAQEWVTRAIAIVVADLVGGDVIDIVNYQVLTTERASATLPDDEGRVRLADWIWVDYSADSTGYWCTTKGLCRFGLPELQTVAAPGNVVEAWGRTMTGLGRRLIDAWSRALAEQPEAAFIQLPSTMEIGPEDVSEAYARGLPGRPPASAQLRLTLDPGADPSAGHAYLTIHPPLDWSGSAGEHINAVCRTLYGPPPSGVRHTTPSPERYLAFAAARAGLPKIRRRFESGSLDVRLKLLVKYALPTEHGTEYPWAYVTSWRDPERILATSAADGVYDLSVRAGRPVVVAADTVVDWALEHDRDGIVEGGFTQAALDE